MIEFDDFEPIQPMLNCFVRVGYLLQEKDICLDYYKTEITENKKGYENTDPLAQYYNYFNQFLEDMDTDLLLLCHDELHSLESFKDDVRAAIQNTYNLMKGCYDLSLLENNK